MIDTAATVNIPQDVIEAAFKVRRYFEAQGWQKMTLAGVGVVTLATLQRDLWDSYSPMYTMLSEELDKAQAEHEDAERWRYIRDQVSLRHGSEFVWYTRHYDKTLTQVVDESRREKR